MNRSRAVRVRAFVLNTSLSLASISGASTALADLPYSGRIDLRAVSASGGEPWAEGGPSTQRYASGRDLRLAHSVLVVDWQSEAKPLDARLVLHAADDRPGVVDATELLLRWKPLPDGPWRSSVRTGAFFPEISRESGGLGWTPTRGLSTSAGNAWIGEELRTIGVEATWSRGRTRSARSTAAPGHACCSATSTPRAGAAGCGCTTTSPIRAC
jgi:hypothetical protein